MCHEARDKIDRRLLCTLPFARINLIFTVRCPRSDKQHWRLCLPPLHTSIVLAAMGPSLHRLPVQLPVDKTTLEEVILARKMMWLPLGRDHDPAVYFNAVGLGGRGEEQQPHIRSADPLQRRGMLAPPVSPASYVSRLPPESYTRDVSNRLGKRPRSSVVNRATASRSQFALKHGMLEQERNQKQQEKLRPLTSVSPPPTAPRDMVGFADYTIESRLRPMVRASQGT